MHQALFPTPLPDADREPPRLKNASALARNAAAFEAVDLAACESMAERLEQLADDMGRWSPGAGLIHRVNNIRMLLMGEAHRLRRMAERMRGEKSGGASKAVEAAALP